MLSIPAQAAKAIRNHMKAIGIAGSVTSDRYSGGSSVDAYVADLNPVQYAALLKFAKQYQYGQFNSMEDYYDVSNSRDDLPQVQYVFVNNRPSDELRQKIWDHARANWGDMDGAPVDAKEAQRYFLGGQGMDGGVLIHRLFTGYLNSYWDAQNVNQSQ